MTAADLDRVTTIARLMRAAYPGRSSAYCAERAGLALADVAIASAELLTARACAVAVSERAAVDVTLMPRAEALGSLAGLLSEEVSRG